MLLSASKDLVKSPAKQSSHRQHKGGINLLYKQPFMAGTAGHAVLFLPFQYTLTEGKHSDVQNSKDVLVRSPPEWRQTWRAE